MIQDIAPHRFDRTYVIGKPDANDIALCVRKGKVLLRRRGEEWALPRFGDGVPTADALHVFSLDGVDCYLARTPDSAPEGTEYVDVGGIRAVRPMEVAFAAITAVQLHRWYGARQYCGRCGHKTKPSDVERAMVCPECGQIEYPKICPAVIVAVTHGDQLLLTRLRQPSLPGLRPHRRICGDRRDAGGHRSPGGDGRGGREGEESAVL